MMTNTSMRTRTWRGGSAATGSPGRLTTTQANNWHPADVALLAAGLSSSMGGEPWGYHLTNVAAARRRGDRAVPGVAADDGRTLAQRLRGGRVRRPSLARRIGGLGGRTQGRAQRPLLHAYVVGLCRLRPPACLSRSLRGRVRAVRLGADGQADAGNAAAGAVAVGLLAAGTHDGSADRAEARGGKAAVGGAVGCLLRRDVLGPGSRRSNP